ncbi:DUF2254 domain-containing protein [Puerhibacterium sp. TATVAM-FAB25]|uniref:DUF2254 domain-containing protein n=1 Tax=Puerhibacterium sp. TATVAM-FAB25 TaxID=3093699 RepID=UPI00397B4252
MPRTTRPPHRLQTHRPAASRTERTGPSLWVWPAVAGLAAVAAGLLLTELAPARGSGAARTLWPGDVAAAAALLQTVATAAMATLTMAFSVTVVALQLASQQFSPRLLRDFLRDRTIKCVLAVLVATISLAFTVLRRLDADAEPPASALFLVLLLAAASVAAIVVFIAHITRLLRVDTMMTMVHDEAQRAIAIFYPDRDDPRPQDPDGRVPAGPGTTVPATRGGFVRSIDVATLVATTRQADVLVHVEARPGDHLASGTPLLTVWGADRGDAAGVDPDLLAALAGTVDIGHERTIEQDAGFGFRQLADIAVKALSPGINDPVTAAHAVGHMAELLVALTHCRLGPTLHVDDAGTGRAVVPDRDFRYYLDIACGQVRRYGRREPTVLIALLQLCRDVAVVMTVTLGNQPARQASASWELAGRRSDRESARSRPM